MSTLLSAMAAIFGVWLLALASWYGLALGIRRFFGLPAPEADDAWLTLWTGLAVEIAILQLWNLWLPIDVRAWAPILCLAGLGYWGQRGTVLRVPVADRCGFVLWCGLGVVAGLWLANLAVDPPTIYDNGLYHVQTVKWTTTYPVVPGLGNLFAPLAYNSTYFLHAAFLQASPIGPPFHHVVNGSFVWPLLLQVGASLRRVGLRGRPLPHHVLETLLFGLVLLYCRSRGISSPTPDMAVAVLSIVLFSLLWRHLFDNPGSLQAGRFRLVGLTLLCMTAATMKVTFGAFCLLTLFMALWAHSVVSRSSWRENLLVVAVCGVVLVLPWLGRGIVLTGYPLFPSTVAPLPVKWRVPPKIPIEWVRYTRGWARVHGEGWPAALQGWSWVWPWLSSYRGVVYLMWLPLSLGVGSLGILFAVRVLSGHLGRVVRLGLASLIVPVVYLAYWFVTIPDIRFAAAAFWLVGVGPTALVLGRTGKEHGPPRVAVLIVAAVLCAWGLPSGAAWVNGPSPHRSLSNVPRQDVVAVVTAAGAAVYVPTEGRQCWDAPLPCTPEPRAALSWRDPADLSAGFEMQ